MTRFFHKYSISFWLCAMIVVLPVYADNQVPSDTSNPDSSPTTITDTQLVPAEQSPADPAKIDDSDTSIIDVSHQTISENIIGLSHRVDSFFSNERVMEESFGSYGCLRLNVFYSEGGERETSSDICLKIDLPHTKKRWKLLFESDDLKDPLDGNEGQGASAAGVDDGGDRSSTATFRYVAEQELLKHISFDIGVKTRTPLDPFTRLRFRRTWVPDPWLFRLTESLYYFKSTEGGFLSRLDMERKFGKVWYARLTTEADYKDVEKQFNLAQSFGFYRRVGKGRALNVELLIIGESQPNPRVEYYVYRFRYKINVWRKWFFIEVSPQLLHQRENDFDSEAGILFSAEALFGNF